MGKYIDQLVNAANQNVVATGGINSQGLDGAFEEVFFAIDGQEFDSVLATKSQANWDAAAVAGSIIYLGKCRFEDQSEEAQNFTDQPLNIDEETVAATKVIRAITQVNAAVHAEIKKMDGKSGRVFFRTTNGICVARIDDDGDVKGLPCSISVTRRTLPTTDTPVEYTQSDIKFTDPDGDELNPARINIDFLFSEVEQVFPLSGFVSNVSSNGSQIDFDLDLDKTGSTDPLETVPQGNFEVVDEDQNVLPIASFSETSGVYSFGVTTALTTVYVRFTGRNQVGQTYYYLDSVIVKV